MFSEISELFEKINIEVSKLIVGKSAQLRLMFATILSEGHILLDDLPGVGKTTLVKSLSRALGCDFKRIQFTPDLLPSDIVGMNIFDRETGSFRRIQGPVMTNLLLADELNRAIPRTQAALLEAMAEQQVTLDGETSPLPRPFVVMATQNPVESESTFRLPAAQLDRFMVCLSLGYLSPSEEADMLRRVGGDMPFDSISPVTNPSKILEYQEQVQTVLITDEMTDYIVSLVSATRTHPLLKLGASPRASREIYRCSKALAAISGRDYVTPDDVQKLLLPVLEHRLVPRSEARISGKTSETVLRDIMGGIQPPPDRTKLFEI